uniref:Uncharacterized protein n=1 Tax=Gadus morhua TaxID=8049 RepID=A0A8C5AVI1_GADMO
MSERILNSINDLKKIPFGQSVPQHSLVLLHWFANTIEINNDTIVLTFEPDHGDYGTHHYRNYETVLNPLPFGQQYYTLGNINPMRRSLPSYFTNDDLFGHEELNRARIIFTLSSQNTIVRVYITLHYTRFCLCFTRQAENLLTISKQCKSHKKHIRYISFCQSPSSQSRRGRWTYAR